MVALEESDFKVYTDCDTPSGDASLLQLNQPGDMVVLSSTALDRECAAMPDPNISEITHQSSLDTLPPTEETPAPLFSQAPPVVLPSLSRPPHAPPVALPSSSLPPPGSLSVMSEPASTISCDLCGQVVKGRAYLAQHRNKKKCLERQRVQKETQESTTTSRSLSLRISESDADTTKVNTRSLSWG